VRLLFPRGIISKAMIFINKIKLDIEKHSQRYLWLSIMIFILFFIFLVLKKYYYFGYNISDLAIFNQTFFNTLHCRWFAETITSNNYLADHFSPAILLLIPFYAIKPSATTLLIIQVVITALCAWPIFFIAKKNSSNVIFAYGASFLWLVNPFVHRQVLFEFHIFHLTVFLFFWAFYFYQQKKIARFVLFFILTLLTREDAVFLFLGLASFSVIERRSWKFSLNIFIWSLVYFFIAIYIIRLFSPVGSFKFLVYYDWLGGDSFTSIIFTWLKHPLAVLGHIFTLNNIILVFYYFLPFLFVPFFAKKYLLLSLFPFLLYIMKSGGINGVQLHTQYVMTMMPGIFLAYIFGLGAILKNKDSKNFGLIYKNKEFFIILFAFSLLFFSLFKTPTVSVLTKKHLPNYHQDRQKIIDSIPSDASVCADSSFLSTLSLRENLYNIDYAYYGKTIFAERDFILPQVDYILMDTSQFISTKNDSNSPLYWKHGEPMTMPDRWGAILADYNLTYAKDSIFLWQKKEAVATKSLPYFELRSIEGGENELVRDWSLTKESDGQVLKINYSKLDSNYYLVRFYQNDQYWETLFDYGLYSKAQNMAGQTATAYYYLNSQVDSFEIYSYKSRNILGDWSNLGLLTQRNKVLDRVEFSK
jgi:uncharacterized membrane protein